MCQKSATWLRFAWLPAAAVVLVVGVAVHAAIAETGQPATHPAVELTNIDIGDFVTILKWMFSLGGLFLIIFAAMCLNFFGVNVRDARNEIAARFQDLFALLDKARSERDGALEKQNKILDDQRQLLKQSDDALRQITHDSEDIIRKLREESSAQQNKIRDRWIELDSTLREAKSLLEKLKAEATDAGEVGASLEEAQNLSVVARTLRDEQKGVLSEQAKQERIREIIRSGKFEWTTIGRIMKSMDLPHDTVVDLCEAMPDIQRGRGKKTGDWIYKFKGAA